MLKLLIGASLVVTTVAYGCDSQSVKHSWTRRIVLHSPVSLLGLSAIVPPAHADNFDWGSVTTDSRFLPKQPISPTARTSGLPNGFDMNARTTAFDTEDLTRSVRRQTKVMTREVKSAAYDVEVAKKAAERELKKASKDPTAYAKKKADKASTRVQKEVKAATRGAETVAKEVKKDPVAYAKKTADKASRDIQKELKVKQGEAKQGMLF